MTTNLKTADFNYDLPGELIAQRPLAERDQCRLLKIGRHDGAVSHHLFSDIVNIIKPGDRLLCNDTRVIPARLYCQKETGAQIELLFTQPMADGSWKALAKPAKRLSVGTSIFVKSRPDVRLEVVEVVDDGSRILKLAQDSPIQTIADLCEQAGELPLPHYIEHTPDSSDRQSYQTVFAQTPGAVAAPTAGLHFTTELLEKCKAIGIDISYVTLHVGVGTFRPVTVADPTQHHMHSEWFELSQQTVSQIEQTRRAGGRIVAVGTTVVRVLEHCSVHTGDRFELKAQSGSTAIFILPGYKFKMVDGLITNFHLPCSTLLMLVSAFAGTQSVLEAYRQAVAEKYRFYSYGDAMLLI